MRENRRCAYCSGPADTRDHIPPRKLFARPWPADLIAVPCCGHCNASWSNDDEYFIWVITCSANAVGIQADRARQQRFEVPSSPRRKRMAARLAASAGPTAAVTPAGVYVGTAPGYAVDPQRINRVLARIVRGLHFHECGRRVPADAAVLTRLEPVAAADRDQARDDIQRKGRSVAAGAFQYWLGPANDGGSATICQLQFFGGIIAQGRVEV